MLFRSMTRLPDAVRRSDVEAPDLLCGGTPCQAFSVAGLRRSLDDVRGNLTLTFVELADAIDDVRRSRGEQPAVIFWENVPGVLTTKDNAFGCFLGALAGEDCPLEPPRGRWSDAGVVSGPSRTIAWRILDAQHFGLAQRRRRVFVVASARDDFDPAAVLFESDGVRRDSSPSRGEGKGATGGASDGAGDSGQPYEVANCLTARVHKGINTTLDEGQTPVVCATGHRTHALTTRSAAEEDGTGRGVPIVPAVEPTAAWIRCDCCDDWWCTVHNDHTADCDCPPLEEWETDPYGLQVEGPAVHALDARQSDVLQYGDRTGPLDTDGHSIGVFAFVPTQVTSPTNRSQPKPGDPCHTLAAQAHAPAVAFQPKNITRGAGSAPSVDVFPTLKSDHGRGLSDQQPHVLCAMQVRRLTPRECERLQGFPDDYTAIPWRGKPADQCPDGPRYKALGNSWAVPVVRWIGGRIAAALEAAP